MFNLKSLLIKWKPSITDMVAYSTWEKMTRWIIFNVIIALLPLLLNYFIIRTSGRAADMAMLIAKGEILLISAAIAAGAIGELLNGGDGHRIAKYVAGGSCVILLFMTAGWFTHIHGLTSPANIDFITSNSIVLFIATMVTSAWCVTLSEL